MIIEFIPVALLVLLLAVWLVGGAMRRKHTSLAEVGLKRVETKLDWLYREHQQLLERVAQLESRLTQHAPEPIHEPPEARTVPEPVPSPPPVPQEPQRSLPSVPGPDLAAADDNTGRTVSEVSSQAPSARRPTRSSKHAGSDSQSLLARLLFGGNTVVRLGVVILFFGVAFLMKYTYERVHVPIELRLTGVALGALALLVAGWRLRGRRPGYAVALQGGGIGVLYLTSFSALRLFGVLPPGMALLLLTLICVFSALLALLQNSATLAMLGAGGGFLAPVLASTGSGSHVQLFSYYVLLNAGILLIAWQRSWRALNLLGFAFTFVIGGLWGWQYYRPELFASTSPFLATFFLMYVAVSVLYARREALSLRAYVDGTLVFGTPLVAFGYQLALVKGFEFGAAWSALGLGAFYILLVGALRRGAGTSLNLLLESFLALGVVFITVAIPLGFEGRWTAAVWALEGAAILWTSVRQARLLGRVFGVLLQFGAGTAFLLDIPSSTGTLPVLNSACLGGMLVAVAGLFCARYLERQEDKLRAWEQNIGLLLFVWGAAWWAGTGLLQIERHVLQEFRFHAALLLLGVSWAVLSLVARHLNWHRAESACPALTCMIGAGTAQALIDGHAHPLAGLGSVAWPSVFVIHLWLLRRHETEVSRVAPWLHAIGLWCVALLGAWECSWWVRKLIVESSAWALVGWALIPGAVVAWLSKQDGRDAWPIAEQRRAYHVLGCGPLIGLLVGWTLYATFTNDGDPAPLPYIVLLNPLDLALLGIGFLSLWWRRVVRGLGLEPFPMEHRFVAASLVAVGFVVVNGVLLRALHHWGAVPFELERMLASVKVQSAFSVFWTALALTTMLVARRRASRSVWMAGAALMGVVVVKLFVLDLSNVGGIERVVSFMGVGVLMLVIGYFSPVPPKKEGEA